MAKNKNNVRKKPTAKEMASAIIEINNRTNELLGITRQLDSIFGLYIEMKGDKEQFNAYVERRCKRSNNRCDSIPMFIMGYDR